MNFKSITALGLVLSLLVGVQLADAASKKTSTISKKQLERLLKKSKSNKNECYFITVTNGSQSTFTDKLTGNKAVSNIVKLLENDTAKHRQTKQP